MIWIIVIVIVDLNVDVAMVMEYILCCHNWCIYLRYAAPIHQQASSTRENVKDD